MSKTELLGVVHKLPITDNNEPSKMKLKEPFISGESVVKVFCSGCGHHSEITGEIISSFPEFTEVVNQKNFENKFLQVRRCVLCDNRWQGVELKDIDSVT